MLNPGIPRGVAGPSVLPLSALLSSALLLCGCVLYSSSRTFYEPDPADGRVHSDGCGYLRTRGAVERGVDSARLDIAFVDERAQPATAGALALNVAIRGAAGEVEFDPHRLRLAAGGASVAAEPAFIDQHPAGPHNDKGIVTQRYTLSFPIPAGNATDVTVELLPGALSVSGAPLAVAPFHFHRVTQSDLYVAAAHCSGE